MCFECTRKFKSQGRKCHNKCRHECKRSKILVQSGSTRRPERTSSNIYLCLTRTKNRTLIIPKKHIKWCLGWQRNIHMVQENKVQVKLTTTTKKSVGGIVLPPPATRVRQKWKARAGRMNWKYNDVLYWRKIISGILYQGKKVRCPAHKGSGRKRRSVFLGLLHQQESSLLS